MGYFSIFHPLGIMIGKCCGYEILKKSVGQLTLSRRKSLSNRNHSTDHTHTHTDHTQNHTHFVFELMSSVDVIGALKLTLKALTRNGL